MDRKKEWKRWYREYRPKMGIYRFQCRSTGDAFLGPAKDVKSAINGTRARLNGGQHPNPKLQEEWREYGEADFAIEVLEELPYGQDEARTDYEEELELLYQMVLQREEGGERIK